MGPPLPPESPKRAAVKPPGWPGVIADWSADRQVFSVSWGKAMMWLFLLSDLFLFASLLIGYMAVRISTTAPWPNTSEVFALTIAGSEIPLILIALMTFILISSSGAMAIAVNLAYRRRRAATTAMILVTLTLGLLFLGMQVFEWSKLIVEDEVRPWGNPMGAAQFGASFFIITGFHGLHVAIGVIYLAIVALKVFLRGDEPGGSGRMVEIAGLYWHFVDLVWVFIFGLFYLW